MITLAGTDHDFARLRAELHHERLESTAIVLCQPVRLHDVGGWRLIVRETHVAPPEAYEERTETSAKLHPAFGLPHEKRAKGNGWSIVYCHTHPHQSGTPAFSQVDDDAEGPLAAYAAGRSPGVPHGALLFGSRSAAARLLGAGPPMRVVAVGAAFETLHDPRAAHSSVPAFDRQIRAFGAEGQRRLQLTRVGIVGLGGTGSLVAQQLAHLGIEDYVLIDRDTIDETNLNRTAGAVALDVGAQKVAVAERMIRAVRPRAKILALDADVVDPGVGRRAAEADVLFCCTDSQASRHLLNQLAHQFLVPVIDLGVAIDVPEHGDLRFSGHVQALAPGLPCLWCTGNLDPRQVREELMDAAHRNADPYFGSGGGVVQPAVMSLNGTMASLAVTMFLSMVAGVPAPARLAMYDGNRTRVSAVVATADPSCNFCSPSSTALAGDSYPLPERRRGEG